MRRHHVGIGLITLGLLFFTACENKDDGVRCNFTGCIGADGQVLGGNGSESNVVSCSAIPRNNPSQFRTNWAVDVTAFGGTAPYNVVGTSLYNGVTGFPGQTSIFPQPDAVGDLNGVQVVVQDAAGRTGTCSFSVSVSNDAAGGAGCSIVASNESPRLSEDINLDFELRNSPPDRYRFQFYPDASSSRHMDTLETFTTEASQVKTIQKTHKYDTRGIRTAKLVVRNLNTGVSVECSAAITVRDPSFKIIAEPSSVAVLGSKIKLTMEDNGDFLTDPTYSVAVSDASVLINQIDVDEYELSTTSLSSLRFEAEVKATADGEEISVKKEFKFGPTVACSLNADSPIMAAGKEASFTLLSANGQAVNILEADAGIGGTVKVSGAQITVVWDTGGTKKLSVLAETDNEVCNDGNHTNISAEVIPKLSCTVATGPMPSATTSNVTLTASVNREDDSFSYITDITSVDEAGLDLYDEETGEWGAPIIGLKHGLSFFYPGIFPINVKVIDELTGQTAECSWNHTAILVTPACRASFYNTNPRLRITEARPHENLSMLVESNLAVGEVAVNPGAPFHYVPKPKVLNFPVYVNNIVYAPSAQGPTVATAAVTKLGTGATQYCQATINLNPPASCTMSGPSHVLISKVSQRGNSHKDTGPDPIHYTVRMENAKPPITYQVHDGCGNSFVSAPQTSFNYEAPVKFLFSGTYTPKVRHIDLADKIPDSCNPGPVKVDKKWEVYYSGSNGGWGTLQVCNYTDMPQTIWIAGGKPVTTWDFHGIPPGGCMHRSFSTTDHMNFYARFKTLHNWNPKKRGLRGQVCLGHNNTTCGMFFPDL